ncbi:MAG: tripartite tricarboxylate transporter substrate binding protein [Rubrivivax sp.]
MTTFFPSQMFEGLKTRRLQPLLGIALLAAATAQAQPAVSYPKQPIRMVVGFPAGGISDVLARAIAARMTIDLGQTVFVENKPGAGTTIASDLVSKAAPDGYTIFLQDITTHAINATLYTKLSYDSQTDFTPIGLFASTPLMLVVNAASPARSVKELSSMLKASPGKYSYASSGNGTIIHLASELLKSTQGLDVVHIPYKGSLPATQSVLTNDVAFLFSSMPPALANVKAGKLRALAVTTPSRVAAEPEVPTMKEAGLPNFEVVLYSGLLGPKGMDPAIVSRLNGELAKVVQSDEIRKVFANLGADPIVDTPQALADRLGKEITKYAPIVKASGVRID